MKIPLVSAEMFYADGGTHVPKLIVAFRSFANAPKIKKMDCKLKYYKCKKKWGVYDNALEIEGGVL
jgi:hypothetical protein